MEQKFQKIKETVEKELSCSAHNKDHVMRVYNLSLHLAENENVDLDVLKASALLHDIARVKEDNDHTGKTDHAILSSEMAVPILQELNFSDEQIKHIQDCIISHRYRTGNEAKTKEAQILFDADKLDTLGAIGIARSFVWVGRNNAKIYTDTNIEKYIDENLGGKINGRIQDKTKHSPQIEFETKLKFLITKLHTKKAKEVCKERIEFYKSFLDRLKREINGEL
ncbi:MAG: HD domain-containing protein [Nanoarchaeota archaeon]|nr:HD domain-containing protein [Nanoarchaeota archaeon]